MQHVEVRYRGRRDELVAHGARADGVVGFRWGFDHEGRVQEQTSFVLLDEGMLIAQPVVFDHAQRGWWYCDLVTIDDGGTTVAIEDLFVDILVGPPTAPYRLLDLDELATALAEGAVDLRTATAGLAQCQRFLDRRLNRRHDTAPTWPDFPPRTVSSPQWAKLPRDWEWRPREPAPTTDPST